jgi:queuine/archaeosine tRNA-ribosyltransferase
MIPISSIKAIGALFYSEEQRKRVAIVPHSANEEDESEPEPAPTAAKYTLTPIETPAFVEESEEGDETDRMNAAITARRKRRMATHGARPLRLPVSTAMMKDLQREVITTESCALMHNTANAKPTHTSRASSVRMLYKFATCIFTNALADQHHR